MLITNVLLFRQEGTALRVEDGHIKEIGKKLHPYLDELVIDGKGGLLLPSLNDHHIHFLSLSAARQSVICGPPAIETENQLAEQLQTKSATDNIKWIRGVGYHESVAGNIDKFWLDIHTGGTPTRIQHRSGRLWIINTAAEKLLKEHILKLPKTLQTKIPTDGRIYDQDELIHLISETMDLDYKGASIELARYGITGINDMTPRNNKETTKLFKKLQKSGDLLQSVKISGTIELSKTPMAFSSNSMLSIGSTKIHLHEADLPDFSEFCQTIAKSHELNRGVAVHCVTELELVYAISALSTVGAIKSDRIEHASVTPPNLIDQIAELDIQIITQPHFIEERGNHYYSSIDPKQHDWLYRCSSYLEHNVRLAAGSDAPFGSANPWLSMKAATLRKTADGTLLGSSEKLRPMEAIDLYIGSLDNPSVPRTLSVGSKADLCLINQTWEQLIVDLSQAHVSATFLRGELIYDGINQPPI
tara:strand:+ start:11 stop:1432 length:1422 start_codon:yes stop_codon:yes gene_type:complete